MLLKNPPSKENYKKLPKTNFTDFWQTKLGKQSVALENKSLKYFKPKFMLLRGSVTKKTGKFGKNSQRGWVKKKDENSQF